MKKAVLYIIAFVSMTACSGEKESPESAVISAFNEAYTAFADTDYNKCIEFVDFASEMDSVQRKILLNTLTQYQDYSCQTRREASGCSVISVVFSSDSVCDVFYELAFSDSTRDICSQKMVRSGEVWRIRLRN